MSSVTGGYPVLLPAFNPSSPSPSIPSTKRSHTPTAAAKHNSPASPSPSSFFSRARSNSFHNTQFSSSSSSLRTSDIAPPVPALPQGFYAIPSSSSSSSLYSGSPRRRRPSIDTTSNGGSLSHTVTPRRRRESSAASSTTTTDPSIKSVSVPHHAKAGGKWVFACRVVPDGCGGPSSSSSPSALSSPASVSMGRNGSLGRMEIAGSGHQGASEPHTVWRTWGEFVEFSSRLSSAFPTVPASTSFTATSSSHLPSSFYRQTPRLSKKLTLFVTRSTLAQRQDDLDLFVRRLFEMPDVVKRSSIVRDFFRIREHDLLGTAASSSSASPIELSPGSPGDDEVPESFARFLSDVTSPDATIKAATIKASKARPALNIKRSTPDLRKLVVTSDADSVLDAPLTSYRRRPLLSEYRTATLDDSSLRSSNYSVATTSSTASASSSATVTPATSTAGTASRLPSPLASQYQLPPLSLDQEQPGSLHAPSSPLPDSSALPRPAVEAKRPSVGRLRHFLSLQDLRAQPSATVERALPPPVPTLSSVDMIKSQTQPLSTQPSLASNPISRSSAGGGTPRHSHRRTASSSSKSNASSSVSSFEEIVGGPYSNNPTWPGGFRQGPSGRLDRVPEGFAGSLSRPRRPSNASRTFSGTRMHPGHSPSPSGSSIASSSSLGSSDMSRSMSSPGGYLSSRRSSTTDCSDGGSSFMPATPPTPQLEGEFVGGKYFVSDNGLIAQNNKVPLPPFFPVPPSMSSVQMALAHSYEGLPVSPRHGHRRKGSSETRSRTGSASSMNRPPMDAILGSPLSTSSGSSTANSSPLVRPQDRPNVTFKVLHPEANFVLRVPRTIKLAELRSTIDRKALDCSIKLSGETGEGQWALSYTTLSKTGIEMGSSPLHSRSELIITEDEFQLALRRTEHLEKVALRIVS